MYQVKFELEGGTRYGIVNEYSSRAKVLPEDKILIEDAITPEVYVIERDKVSEISFDTYPNEFDRFITKEREAAYERSKSLKSFTAGKVFSVHVGDGHAYYEVTNVTPTQASIEWRGYSPDRWIAPLFGYGGLFARKQISDLVKSEERINALFAQQQEG